MTESFFTKKWETPTEELERINRQIDALGSALDILRESKTVPDYLPYSITRDIEAGLELLKKEKKALEDRQKD